MTAEELIAKMSHTGPPHTSPELTYCLRCQWAAILPEIRREARLEGVGWLIKELSAAEFVRLKDKIESYCAEPPKENMAQRYTRIKHEEGRVAALKDLAELQGPPK